jgi:regulator of sigma E protease
MIGDLFHKAYVVLAVLLFFGASVFVHEYGHFWMARFRRMVVLGFSIGFGPKILGWKDRHGVEWALRWIPAGGFVKLPQMLTSEAIEGSADPSIAPASPMSRIWVALAGPFMNLVFALVIASVIWWVGLPVHVNPPIIGYVEPDSPEARMGIREGDRIVRVDGKRVKSWQEVQRFTVLARSQSIPVEIARGDSVFHHVLTATENPTFGLKLLNLDPRDHPVVMGLTPGGAAEEAGLRVDDQFISVGGVPVVGQAQLIDLIRERTGKASPVEVQRGKERLTFSITPRLDPTTGTGRIGVTIAPSRVLTYQLQRPGPTPWEQISGVVVQMGELLGALAHSKETGIGPKDMSGPVGIFGKLAADVNADIRLALSFLVLLNVNLAIINLLPIPVLDGGHITLALYELVTRRRVGPRFQEIATSAFAVLLLSFMAYVSFFDLVKRGPLFKAMFRQETVIETPATPTQAP